MAGSSDRIERVRLSDLEGSEVVTGAGRRRGRVFDVRARYESAGAPPAIESLLLGRGGLLRRLGIRRGSLEEIPIDQVEELGRDRIVVRG
ncbi:MAG TPA: hypothetical protein VF545_09330 [Thermoleophilaceae bacterium]